MKPRAALPDEVGRVDVAREGGVAPRGRADRRRAASFWCGERSGLSSGDAPAVVVEVGRDSSRAPGAGSCSRRSGRSPGVSGSPSRPGRPEAPLAHRAGRVAEPLAGPRRASAPAAAAATALRAGPRGCRGSHACPGCRPVSSTPRDGRADGVARVVLREAHPLRREPVERRRADLLLAVAAELGPAEVVGQDEDDVGSVG